MLRKVIWFALILFVGYVWFSFLLKCSNTGTTAEKMAQLDAHVGEEEDVVFQADEDSGDDGYIISNEDDTEDRVDEEMLANTKENPRDDKDDEEEEEDLVEKSPVSKKITKPISRKAIRETSYSSDTNIGYYVITGSFSEESNADNMVIELKDMGYSGAEKIVFDFSQYYSVISGKYDTESSARAKSLELKNKNINAYVHKMRSKLFGD